ncbi:urea carboxylase [Roseibacillus persicicus]|uniref:Urea carboxylase n=1 Tax=Roseibacillus persicicus TaxID=454148 RepID=A0A918WLT1_9BACT|nr:urea carboxylase [Roseibacillus persicicus]GHC57324.1 urea carboxylase [Roseibacillus persicicus]
MFKKVLISNRGEIALRISRTLRKMGIQVVAVYSEADRSAPHVLEADEAYLLGPSPVSESYLNVERLLAVIAESGAEAVHPGYGLLSENSAFADQVEAAGCVWLGPTGQQMEQFGKKHAARELAERTGVPLCPGTDLLVSVGAAVEAAEELGYPVMLKSTAGGGGIGMQVCANRGELEAAFATVVRLAESNFGEAGVFLERYVVDARHIEIQIFGDGAGKVVSLGDRDCSAQRRNQKVIEETPAPGISSEQRAEVTAAAVSLGSGVNYRSAGTVEFIYDTKRQEFYFLEMNCRLQVEHGVTELVTGVDIVEWMVLLGAGDSPIANVETVPCKGAAIEARIYAEDPGKDYRPSSGMITEAIFPHGVRCDTWISAGTEVSAFYDPLLAKVQSYGKDRDEAVAILAQAISETRIGGVRTNLALVGEILESSAFREGGVTTRWLPTLTYAPRTFEVLRGGTMTTVQDWPGRLGYWDVGVPPSGPMDSVAFRLANRLVGNAEGTAGLEITMAGPSLRFGCGATVALTGAEMQATLDGEPVEFWKTFKVEAGQTLDIGASKDAGCRSYLAIAGGIDVPEYLGSRATFTLGQFGGHSGRALVAGDVLDIFEEGSGQAEKVEPLVYPNHWEIAVLYGPHGAPDFFTEEDIETFFATDWEVHFNSARTGVRLIGPKPKWARPDGGEAGLHPSNIHDNAYGIGAVDFTGDMPVILGPDGPSLGGFVCPATIIEADVWKMGQLRPGDTIRFLPVSMAEADRLRGEPIGQAVVAPDSIECENPVIATTEVDAVPVVVRRTADEYVLLEIGEMELDLRLRFRVHLLYEWLKKEPRSGFVDLTPGIRSLQVHYNPGATSEGEVVALLFKGLQESPPLAEAEVSSRVVHLPLSWDDPSTQLAIERYASGVRPDAPWCPSNIEFIRRINGLDSIDEVKEIVYDADYLVMGLGDVYLGAPVATPLDPRHRLVTTKYNPARTWTPENAVGIGGAYLCIYGMEGPGGYQFVGRTVPIWNRYQSTPVFVEGKPWMLRFFDRIKWYEVSADELMTLREQVLTGQFVPKVEEGRFNLGEYIDFLEREADSIADFRTHQRAAFQEERERWEAAGLNVVDAEEVIEASAEVVVPEGCVLVEAPMAGSVWKIEAEEGDTVSAEETVVILEAMKMEMAVPSVGAGKVEQVLVTAGGQVKAGDGLMIVRVEAS